MSTKAPETIDDLTSLYQVEFLSRMVSLYE